MPLPGCNWRIPGDVALSRRATPPLCHPRRMDLLHRGVEALNRVLRPTGFVIVPRTDWVEAMLDRRRRDVPVEADRRQPASAQG